MVGYRQRILIKWEISGAYSEMNDPVEGGFSEPEPVVSLGSVLSLSRLSFCPSIHPPTHTCARTYAYK